MAGQEVMNLILFGSCGGHGYGWAGLLWWRFYMMVRTNALLGP